MCGIAGSIRFRGRVDLDLLVRQRDTMSHRGPDSHGIWCSDDERVAFAHRRLAIIDLSPAGHQPMVDHGTGNVITFNGEIYNYVELRDLLKTRGHQFNTASDTEVILASYREWGEECLDHLDGMFAFALFDIQRKCVLLARDRAGEKPFYYFKDTQGLSFASELKALLVDPAVPRRVRRQSLNEYLAYGYVSAENCMLAGIHRLAPASRALVILDSQEIRIKRYWCLPAFSDWSGATAKIAEGALTVSEPTDALHGLLRESVTRQLVSDVPVGILLSGGVDSSLIAAIAAEVSPERVRTFTVRFRDNKGFDEGPHARLVAKHLNAEHTELYATPADADLLQTLVRQFDDPISDSSIIPTYLLSREIRKHATVALGGDGGDELFGGYKRYPIQIQQDRLRQLIPQFVRNSIATMAKAIMSPGQSGRSFAIGLSGDKTAGLSFAGRSFRVDERRALSKAMASLSDAELSAPEQLRRDRAGTAGSVLQRSTALDFTNYLADDVLLKVDRSSMLCSLEVRAPFLDRSVVEFAFGSLPDSMRATARDRKIILRKLGARLLPSALDLRRKQGFSIPVDEWMKSDWQPLIAQAEASGSLLLEAGAIASYRAMLGDGQPVGDKLFSLLFLSMWEREYGISDVSD